MSSSNFHETKIESFLDWATEPEQKGDWQEAIKRWRLLTKAEPTDSTVHFRLINALINSEQIHEASELIKKSEKDYPKSPTTLLQKARVALKKQSYDEANRILDSAKKQFSNIPEVWLLCAEYSSTMMNFSEADFFNKKARELNPNNMAAYRQYSELAMRAENWGEALSRWKIFRELFPTHPSGYFRAAEVADKLGQKKLARQLRLAKDFGNEVIDDEPDIGIVKNLSIGKQKTFSNFFELIFVKSILQLRSETERHFLGNLWWFLEPLLHLSVYYLVFGILMRSQSENYLVFLITGLIPFMWFNKSVIASSNSIVSNQGLILQLSIPSIIFPLTSTIQSTYKSIPALFVMLGFVSLFSVHPVSFEWLATIPIFIVQFQLITLIGLILAAVVPFIRDFSYIIPTGMTFLMFLSGVFYNYQDIPEKYQSIYLMNPVSFILKSYRDVLFYGSSPDYFQLCLWFTILSITLFITYISYTKFRYSFPRVITS